MSSNELEIRQRHFLKSKDKKRFLNRIEEIVDKENLQAVVKPNSKIEWFKVGDHEELYAIDNVLTFWINDKEIIPLLSFLKDNPNFPWKSITVDKGAIKFMSNGADVMRPGILNIDEDIEKGDIILIKDPIHGRVLSVGKAMYSSEDMTQREKGKVVKCVHSLQDKIWAFSKDL